MKLRPRLLLGSLVLFAVPCLLAFAPAARLDSAWADITRRAQDVALVPSPDALTPYILAVLESYPSDGSHAYWWPKGSEAPKGWVGNARDLHYDGELVYKGDAKGRCYCCGLTFEVFFEASRLLAAHEGRDFRIGDLDRKGVEALRRRWFGSKAGDACARAALVDSGLGFAVDFDAARPGDFLQFWRANGSGHSAIFLRWVYGFEVDAKSGKQRAVRRGFEYWSTQKSTKGIGVRREFFAASDSDKGAGVLRSATYLARAGRAK